jgi:hypothetical protein
MSNSITKEELLEYYTYNQNEGEFYLRDRLIGSVDRQGYIILKYKNETYRLNELIYFIHNNYLLTKDDYIIHINGNRSDSRIENLRLVDRENNREVDETGIYYYTRLGKFASFVDRGKVRSLIGYYDVEEEAIAAREKFNNNTKNNNAVELPEQKYLQECINYSEDTGLAYWRERPIHHFNSVKKQAAFNNNYANKLINSRDNKNYIIAGVDRKYYKLHRLIWKMVYGEDPKYFIDHINGDSSDNRISNLRDIDNTYNQRNHTKLSVKNTSGYIGVSPHKSFWRASIKKDNINMNIGLYGTSEEAAYARELKMIELYGEEFYHRNEDKKILLEELKIKLGERKVRSVELDLRDKLLRKAIKDSKTYTIKKNTDLEGYHKILYSDDKFYGRIIYDKVFIETDKFNTQEEACEAILNIKRELDIS